MQVKGNGVHDLLKYAQRWKRTKQNLKANNFAGVNESIAFARFIKNIYSVHDVQSTVLSDFKVDNISLDT